MLYKPLKIVLTSLSIIIVSYAQQHTIMTYNILNYPGSTSAIRNPHFITVLSNTEPDILVTQEMLSQGGTLLNLLKDTATAAHQINIHIQIKALLEGAYSSTG